MEQYRRETNGVNDFHAQGEEETRREELLSELRTKRNRMMAKDQIFYHERAIEKSNELQRKYSGFLDYELYHLMIASTLNERPPKFDFPGEDSVELFLNNLYAEMFPQEGGSTS